MAVASSVGRGRAGPWGLPAPGRWRFARPGVSALERLVRHLQQQRVVGLYGGLQAGAAGQDVVGVELRGDDLLAVERIGAAGGDGLGGDLCGFAHQPAADYRGEQLEEGFGHHQAGGGLGGHFFQQRGGGRFQVGEAVADAGADGGQRGVAGIHQGRCVRTHVGHQGGQHLAAVAGDLAAGEVGGLDGGGAFVDRGDAGVAHVLGDAGFFDEAHAAEDLDRQRGEFHRAFGAPALEHRGQQFNAAVGAVALGGVL